MSSSRDSSCSREDSSVKRRSMGTRRETRSKEAEEEGKDGKDNRPIRTRLSTGSIHMNGTTTIAVAKEIENNCRLLTKDSPSGVRKKRLSVVETQREGTPPPKKRKIGRNNGTGEDNMNDYFCWLCHKEGMVVCCELCPRVYHTRCLDIGTELPKEWVCPECEKIMRAECIDTRSPAMSTITVDTLCSLLGFALERMKHQGTEPFMMPVDQSSVLHYSDYIFNPMDLTMIEKNIKKKMYGCTEAFLADAKWILHNCIIFNGTHHKLTASAKMIIKICKHEMGEIELCPDCYWNSCVRKNDEWFAELCRSPHQLVWAKLKGYPFWPAKVLREVDGQVDVRFFGAHDRSLLSTSQVFMLSKNIPTPAKNKKGGFDYSMEELELHIKKWEQKYGKYDYASFRCPYDRKNVYKEGKFKVSPKRRLSSLKFGQANARTSLKETLVKQRQKVNYNSDSKPDNKQTNLSKTALAVRNKYNSIITTRRASHVSSSVENSPVKGGLNVNSSVENSPVKGGTNVNSADNLNVKEKEYSVSSAVDPKSASNIVLKLKTRLQGKIIETNDSKSVESSKMTSNDGLENVTKCEEVDTVTNSSISNVENANKIVDSGDGSTKIKTRRERRTEIVETIQKKINHMLEDEGKETVVKTEESKVKSEMVISNERSHDFKTSAETKGNGHESKECSPKMEELKTEEEDPPEKKLTPTKKDYLSKLEETIKKGKENLGITDEDDELMDDSSTESDDGDDDDETEESDDDDEEEEEDVEMDEEKEDLPQENIKEKEDSCKENLKGKEDLPKENIKAEEENEISDSKKSSKTISDTISEEKTSVEKEKVTSVKDKTTEESKTSSSESKTVGEYDTVTKDILDENTGQITQVKEQLVKENTDSDTGLMMEVETESDTDKLVIDTDDDQTLSPSPKKSLKVLSSKTQSPLEKSKLSKEDTSKSPTERSKTDVMECAPTSPIRKSISPKSKHIDPCHSQTELRSDFFQNAVEKTLKQKPISVVNSANNSTSSVKRTPDRDAIQTVSSSCTTGVKSPVLGVKSPICSVKASSSVKSSVKTSVITSSDNSANKTVSASSSDNSANKTVSASSSEGEDGRNQLISNFTQKVMGPIQTAFAEFFSEVLEQEREKIKQEMSVTKEMLAEKEEKKTKSPEEQTQLEQQHWEYMQQFTELKYNFRLTCLEMKSSWESEKGRLMDEVKEMVKKEKETAINDTKKKQWCAKCGKEAIFYCCWNTSYCDYPCQQAHWPVHMATCMQQTNENDPNKNQSLTNQNSQPSNQNAHNIRQNGPTSNKSAMEIEQEEYQRRQQSQRVEEQQHQQFNVQPNGFMPMHTSPPGVMHSMHRQQESPPNPRKKTVWSDQDMSNAVAAVSYGGMSINKASKVYNVPRNKIAEKVSKPNHPQMNQQMLPGNQQNPQLQLQYVQPPQPMSIPPSVQPFTSPPQMRMPSSQPILTSMIQNQPVMTQNNSILFPVQLRPTQPPMNIPPGMMPQGQLLISQGAQPPRQSPNMMPRSMPYHGRY